MPIVEKIKFNGVNKDISPGSVDNQGNRGIVNPIIDALNTRYFTSDHSDGLVSEALKGTTEISNANLPAGTNKCIGSFEDDQNNLMIFFVYNSNDDHSIFKYNPSDGTITLIIQNSVLNFQDNPLYLITGIGMIGNLLFFSDGINPQRCLNITRDYTYVGFSEADITLNKRPPSLKPSIFPGTDAEVTGHWYFRSEASGAISNLISDKNIQFSYQYVYLDNEQSVIAPPSILARGESGPGFDHLKKSQIAVRVLVDSTINQWVKTIRLLYRENNTGTWKVWKLITPTSGPSYYDNNFTGTDFIEEVAESDSSKISESIPNFSKALCIQKNRLFLTDDQSGFTDEVSSGAIAVTVTQEDIADPQIAYFKDNSKYKVGIALWDENYRSIGVINSTIFNTNKYVKGPISSFEFEESTAISFSRTTQTINNSNKTFVVEARFAEFLKNSIGDESDKVITFYAENDPTKRIRGVLQNAGVLGADPSTGSVSIVSVTSNGSGTYSNWVAIFAAKIDHTSSGPTHKVYRNKVSINVGLNFTPPPNAKYFSVVLSDNLSYDDYFQCFVKPWFYKYDSTSGSVPSDSVRLDGARIYYQYGNVPNSLVGWSKIHLQIPKEMSVLLDTSWYVRILDGTTSELLYVEKVQGIVGGDFVVVDNFNEDNWDGRFDPQTKNARLLVEFFKPKTESSVITYREVSDRIAVNTDGTLAQTSFDLPGDTFLSFSIQSFRYPSHSNSPSSGYKAYQKWRSNVIVELPTPVNATSNILSVSRADVNVATDPDTAGPQYTPDYSKKAISRGIPLIEIEDAKKISTSKTRVRYSNKFIQDTSINGLNSFDAGNSHSISSERGQIKKLIAIGNNVLAVHERACTSLYIEEGIIKTADNQESLSVTNNVIGHDRKLILKYGSYHAESIKEVDGMAFGFDVFKGVVWRYTNEGLHPISNNGMKEYFRQKGVEYLPIKDTCKIIGEIDVFHKEYVITFRKADGSGETWAYNYIEDKWIGRYSFIPEMYGRSGNDLFSFVNGVLWKHNSNSTHNYFYGVQYPRLIKIAVNPYPSKNKIGLGIQIAAQDPLSSDPDEQIIKVYSPSGQETHTKFDEFDIQEGVHYGSIMMDENTPNVDMDKLARMDGDNMRGEYLLIELNTSLSTRGPVRFMNMAYELSEYSQ